MRPDGSVLARCWAACLSNSSGGPATAGPGSPAPWCRRSLLLLDEPFSALDPALRRRDAGGSRPVCLRAGHHGADGVPQPLGCPANCRSGAVLVDGAHRLRGLQTYRKTAITRGCCATWVARRDNEAKGIRGSRTASPFCRDTLNQRFSSAKGGEPAAHHPVQEDVGTARRSPLPNARLCKGQP